MHETLEKLNTCEEILDRGVITEDNNSASKASCGALFFEKLLTTGDSYLEKINMADSPFHQQLLGSQASGEAEGQKIGRKSRYEEERTGLLSNRYHSEKYPAEAGAAASND